MGRQYKALLERAGHTVTTTMSTAPFDGAYDAAMTFNLDRPFESAQFAAHCRARGIPLMLYSLHHPPAGVAHYLRDGSTGFRRVCARLAGWRPDAYESLLTLIKVLGRKFKPDTLADLRYISTVRAQRALLRDTAVVLSSSQSEASAIRTGHHQPHLQYAVVPHILESLGEPAPASMPPRDIDVLCAGRIESRKNQLRVAQLARRFPGKHFVFIGTPSPSESAYFAAFKAEIADQPNVAYFASMPLEQLRAMFRRSRIFISLSWFEVVSLTEMEAYASGCELLVGRYSYAAEFARSGATYIAPDDLAAAERALNDLLAAQGQPAPRAAAAYPDLHRMAPRQVLAAFDAVFAQLGLSR